MLRRVVGFTGVLVLIGGICWGVVTNSRPLVVTSFLAGAWLIWMGRDR